MQPLGRNEGEVPGEQPDGDLRQAIVQPTADLADHPSHDEPQRHAAHAADDEACAGIEQREGSAHGSRHGDAVGDQRGSVVDEALALDQVDDPTRSAEAAHDRRCCDRVGGGDDGAQRERHGPGQIEHVVAGEGDQYDRDQHEPDGRQGERPRVAAKRPHVGEEGRGVQQRRQEDEQHEVRIELGLGDAGENPQHQTAQNEHDRIRDADASGERVEDGDREEHGGQTDLEFLHGRHSRAWRSVRAEPGL